MLLSTITKSDLEVLLAKNPVDLTIREASMLIELLHEYVDTLDENGKHSDEINAEDLQKQLDIEEYFVSKGFMEQGVSGIVMEEECHNQSLENQAAYVLFAWLNEAVG